MSIPQQPEKSSDPDYKMLKSYLTAHNAPQLFLSALNRIIDRAGIRIEVQAAPPESRTFQRKIPMLDIDSVKAYVAAGKTQSEIASMCHVKLRTVRIFMKQHNIRPSYSGIGTTRKIKMETERIDPRFPVPVKVFSHGYAAPSSACHP